MEHMAATDVSGSINKPLRLLVQGKQQYIKVDYKKVLDCIMSYLGAKVPASFIEIGCGIEGVKYAVTLDLSSCNQSVETVVEGKAFTCKETAQTSVLMLVFLHLEQECNVKLIDFSTRVSISLTTHSAYSHVRDALDSVHQALDSFDSCFVGCMDLALELEGGGVHSNISHILAGPDPFFVGIKDFIRNLVQLFSSQSSVSRSKIINMDDEKNRHHETMIARRDTISSKSYHRKVMITSKFLLQHMLHLLGLKDPCYSNGPDGEGMVNAEVSFVFPEVKKLKFGGTIKISGKGGDWSNAEENAAYEALLFIEENFKATLVDLNFTDRLDAEKEQFRLRRMLQEILNVGDSVKEMWESFTKELALKVQYISFESNFCSQANVGKEEIEAFKLCLHGLEAIEKQSVNYYRACCPMFATLEDINYQFLDMNLNQCSCPSTAASGSGPASPSKH